MSVHLTNKVNIKTIIDFYNKNSNNKEKILTTKENINNIYSNLFIICNTLIYIYTIKNNSNLTKRKKIKKILKIKDKENRYIFNKADAVEILKLISNLDPILLHYKQKGGSLNNMSQSITKDLNNLKKDVSLIEKDVYNTNGGILYFVSDLEKKYGTKLSLPLELITSFNSIISYICSIIISTLGYPPFSLPPLVNAVFVPKIILRITKYILIGSNLVLNISRQNWSIVIKNGLSSFPQFLSTQNEISTQLFSINKMLKMINSEFDTLNDNKFLKNIFDSLKF